MVGLLTLHTLPTRETFTLVKTLQVRGEGGAAGAAARSKPAAGAAAGAQRCPRPAGRALCGLARRWDRRWTAPPSIRPLSSPPPRQVSLGSLAIVVGLAAGATVSSVSAGLGLAASYEALRLLLVAVFVVGHRRENIAKP